MTFRTIHACFISECPLQYCPKLEELSLHGSQVRGNQLYRLGQSLQNLHTVTLNSCDVKEFDKQERSLIIDSSVIDRNNGKHLLVQFLES